MKIVVAPDGSVDRIDRALWLTPPFDLLWDKPHDRRPKWFPGLTGGPRAVAPRPFARPRGR